MNYEDILEFRGNPKELVSMFSEALRMMDHNTERYMVNELQKDVEELKNAVTEQADIISKQTDKISEQEELLTQKNDEIALLRAELEKYKKQ